MSSDWYARKLRNDPPAPKQPPLPPTPVARPVLPPQPVVQQVKQFSAPTGSCPNCGSANYGAPSRNIPPRCFDCGEGLAIQNSTQGMSAPGGETTPAVQVPTAGYNPQAIIGKVG